jgi:hypothetical protein
MGLSGIRGVVPLRGIAPHGNIDIQEQKVYQGNGGV